MNATASSFKMACRANSDVGFGARCRHMVDGAGVCSQHQGAALAVRSGEILFKTRVNPYWIGRLEKAGVRWENRDQATIEAESRAEAERLGRSATAIRPTPDSGSQVFGKDGAKNVEVLTVFDALLGSEGYILTDIHLYRAEKDQGGDMATVVFALRMPREGEPPPAQVGRPVFYKELLGCRWGYAHVWANPQQANGLVVHTVNLAHRPKPGDKTPAQSRLIFDEGHWNLEPTS